MKIVVLDHPRIPSRDHFNDIANTPLWSCLMGGYAASALEAAGFETIFLDHALPGARFEETLAALAAEDPDLLCINAVYFWENTSALFDFLKDLRRAGFQGHINLFGFFPTLVYRQILSARPAVDSIAVGEFEHTLKDLAAALARGVSVAGINGLATAETLGHNRPRPPEKNPDLFSFPVRSHLKGTVSILASRGCYNHCSFCPVPSFYNQGPLWRGRSPENIAKEMALLADRGVTSFYFCDPNFIGPGKRGRQRTVELMDRIRPLNIRFGMETRPQDLDDTVLEALTSAGFESLLMGIESGSADVLTRIDKTSGPEASARAIALCRKHGIEPEIGFLMFVPDSDLKDLTANLAFLAENRLLDRLDRTANLLSHVQIVLAGTSGYQRFEAEGRLEKKGIFGFQAGVRFADPAVARVADLLVFACREVLRETGNPESPVYWDHPDDSVSRAVNDYLVDLAWELVTGAAAAGEAMASQDAAQLERDREAIRAGLRGLFTP
ncbi:MAG: radical SAM protein [Desulfobacteraceae bacterium]|nr:radical SAM protein [Desulfobacteraceae bacterium]